MSDPYDNATERVSVLGPTLHFKGELHADEELLIKGRIEGSITHSQRVTVSAEGTVTANVRAQMIVVEGTVTGDLQAEDPLCTHTPGKFVGSPLLTVQRPKAVEYGTQSPITIDWDEAAALRMKKIPAFVRGMVVRAVEDSCRKNGISRVTAEELERIRARMPTPKIFG